MLSLDYVRLSNVLVKKNFAGLEVKKYENWKQSLNKLCVCPFFTKVCYLSAPKILSRTGNKQLNPC